MSKTSSYKVARNSLWNSLSTILRTVLALVSSVIIARTLGPEWFGNYSYVSFIGGAVSQIATIGFPLALVKYISEYAAKGDLRVVNGILKFAVSIELAMVVVVFFLTLLFGVFFIQFKHTLLFLLGALLVFPLAFDYTFGAAIRGVQEYGVNTKTEVKAVFVNLAGVFLVVWLNAGITGFLCALLIHASFLMILRVRAWAKISSLTDMMRSSMPVGLRKELLGYSFIMFINTLITMIIWERSEIFFLERFSSLVEISYYSVSYGLVGKIAEVPIAMSSVLLPASSAMFAINDLEGIKKLFFSSLKFLSFLNIPALIGLIAVCRPLVLFLYGANYVEVVLTVNILAMFATFAVLWMPVSAIVYGLKGHIFLLKTGIYVAVINIILDIMLIPSYGVVGAAFANSIAQCLGTVAVFAYIYVKHRLKFPFLDIFKIYASSLVMFTAVSAIISYQDNVFGIIMAVPAGIVIYFAAARFFKFFKDTDYEYLSRAIDKLPVLLRPDIVKKITIGILMR